MRVQGRKSRVGSGTSDEFGVRVGVHQGFVLSPLIFAIVVDVVTEHAREGMLNEIFYTDDLVKVWRIYGRGSKGGEEHWKARD